MGKESLSELAAFTSKLPFCIDAMEVQTWLQFVFIPNIRQRLGQQLVLPSQCAITPIIEEGLSMRLNNPLHFLRITSEIDAFLS